MTYNFLISKELSKHAFKILCQDQRLLLCFALQYNYTKFKQSKKEEFEGGWNTQNTCSGDPVSTWHNQYTTTSSPVGNKLVLALLDP